MVTGRELLHYFTDSAFRTVELVLATALLLVMGFAIWLVTTQPGSPEGGGAIVGLFLVAGIVSIILAGIVIIHGIVDLGRFVAR